MSTWSAMKKKFETEYLAKSLRGRIQYFVTTYKDSYDKNGRAAILFDGKEIIQGNSFNYALKEHLIDESSMKFPWEDISEDMIELGMFNQYVFYYAFKEFDNQAIEKSLESHNILIKILAVLDRRVGKRKLHLMMKDMATEPDMFKLFYCIRCEAEGIDCSILYTDEKETTNASQHISS